MSAGGGWSPSRHAVRRTFRRATIRGFDDPYCAHHGCAPKTIHGARRPRVRSNAPANGRRDRRAEQRHRRSRHRRHSAPRRSARGANRINHRRARESGRPAGRARHHALSRRPPDGRTATGRRTDANSRRHRRHERRHRRRRALHGPHDPRGARRAGRLRPAEAHRAWPF